MSHKRSQARSHAVQAVYQWQMAQQNLVDIYDQFLEEVDVRKLEVAYFKDMLFGVPKNLQALDAQLKPCLDRSIESVDPVERAVLRLGAYELMFHPEVPYKVVINESVELAKIYGADQGHRFVNGVMDKLARNLRKAEKGKG